VALAGMGAAGAATAGVTTAGEATTGAATADTTRPVVGRRRRWRGRWLDTGGISACSAARTRLRVVVTVCSTSSAVRCLNAAAIASRNFFFVTGPSRSLRTKVRGRFEHGGASSSATRARRLPVGGRWRRRDGRRRESQEEPTERLAVLLALNVPHNVLRDRLERARRRRRRARRGRRRRRSPRRGRSARGPASLAPALGCRRRRRARASLLRTRRRARGLRRCHCCLMTTPRGVVRRALRRIAKHFIGDVQRRRRGGTAGRHVGVRAPDPSPVRGPDLRRGCRVLDTEPGVVVGFRIVGHFSAG
jgi:hypothetical protein